MLQIVISLDTCAYMKGRGRCGRYEVVNVRRVAFITLTLNALGHLVLGIIADFIRSFLNSQDEIQIPGIMKFFSSQKMYFAGKLFQQNCEIDAM